MFRRSVCFAVIAVMFAATAQVEAQRRTPVRNLLRTIGNGWGSGIHARTPGYDPGYYNQNAGQHLSGEWQYQSSDGQFIQSSNGDGQIIYENAIPNQNPNINQAAPQPMTPSTSPTPQTENAVPTIKDNSASRLLNQQQRQNGSRTWQPSQPISNQQSIQHPTRSGTSGSIGDQTRINSYLKPYHSSKRTDNSTIQLNKGGQFQIVPSQTPTSNTGWTGQTLQIQNGQPYTPGSYRPGR